MHGRRYLGCSAVLFCLIAACSGSDGGSGTPGTGGSSGSAGGSGNQDGWWCVCNSGLSSGLDASVTYEQAQTQCVEQCANYGGLETVKPRLSALGTPECNAFCAKADALNCPGAPSCLDNADFWCQVGPDSCVEAERAELQCKADEGLYECTENGWHRSSGCSNYDELCTP